MKTKHFFEIVEDIENEGFDYYINGYTHPDSISNDADENCLKFKKLWEQVLPLLKEMEELVKDNK